MQRNFGIKDVDHFVRVRYAIGKDDKEDFIKYRYLMHNFKARIDNIASLLTNNLLSANSIYLTSLHEYKKRRDFQNNAICNCEQLMKELQRIVDVFDVDLNIYSRYIENVI